MKRLISLLFFAALLFVGSGVRAQGVAPDQLVQNVTEDVLKVLRQDKAIQAGNINAISKMVDTRVLPHFNFRRMTQLAVGRSWREASAAQQNELVLQFHDLLVRTYANAIVSYRDQKVVYKPLKMNPGDTEVLVRTEITQTGGSPITLDYSMEKTDKGWKVYDVVVGGVSLVTNYRETFAQEIRAGGIDGLIRALAEKNKALLEKQNKK
ncbi:MAG: ABC transporter substrate-binding protein [Betaproteobacteria bacterium]|nr:ABC transporter substrate-binding protein [Betaproteobacteria bacterium]